MTTEFAPSVNYRWVKRGTNFSVEVVGWKRNPDEDLSHIGTTNTNKRTDL